jgi:hypothetical protein
MKDLAAADISWTSWGERSEATPQIDGAYGGYVYLKVIPDADFLADFSTREVSYNWYVQFPDEAVRVLDENDIGKNKFLTENIKIQGETKPQTAHDNTLVIDWGQFDEKAVTIYCEIVNTINNINEDKKAAITTQPLTIS